MLMLSYIEVPALTYVDVVIHRGSIFRERLSARRHLEVALCGMFRHVAGGEHESDTFGDVITSESTGGLSRDTSDTTKVTAAAVTRSASVPLALA